MFDLLLVIPFKSIIVFPMSSILNWCTGPMLQFPFESSKRLLASQFRLISILFNRTLLHRTRNNKTGECLIF